MTTTIRAFVAFKLPQAIIDHAAAMQSALRARGLRLRWVKPQSLHLTLKFLGDIPAADAPEVGAAVQSAVHGIAPPELTVQGLGVFPGIRNPRVLWLGLGGQVEVLQLLFARIESELEGLGIAREKRGFKAHLTLARFKERVAGQDLEKALEALGEYEPKVFRARHLVFYKSDLQPRGAVHTPLAEVWLDGSPD